MWYFISMKKDRLFNKLLWDTRFASSSSTSHLHKKNKFQIDQRFKYQPCKKALHEIMGKLFFYIILKEDLSR